MVCYHSSLDELQQLLDSAFVAIATAKAQFSFAPVSFTLIDNSEQGEFPCSFLDQFKAKADSLEVELGLIQGHGNVGYGRGHNLALGQMQSDFHLLLNPDVVMDKQCLSEGLNYLLNQPEAAMVSPLATNGKGEKQYLCKRYPSVLTLFVRGFLPKSWRGLFAKRLAGYEMHELSEAQPTSSIPIASGCFMLCRSAPLQAVKGFDEGYFLYFEDFDLSLRLSSLGNIAYVPTMKITHGGGNAAKKGADHIAMFIRSGIRFFNTHGWCWL